MPELITAMVTFMPCASLCACGRRSFVNGILRGIAFARRLLVLQPIAEIELDIADAGRRGEFAAHDVDGTIVGDAEQADGGADQRKILRFDPHQSVTPRQLIGLRIGQRAIDLGDQLIGEAGAD